MELGFDESGGDQHRGMPDVRVRREHDRKTLVHEPKKKDERHAVLLAMSAVPAGPATNRHPMRSPAQGGIRQAWACDANGEQRSH
ncbi:hypothetical protein VHAB30_33010 [Variovorax boronicumulans]|nr:hypothetical protein VHAB30_33010 [Variovorax boronicumulans]